jgi:hypothetical protein
MHPFPATLPVRVGEEASQDFGVEIAFTSEITIESAMREVGALHNLANGNIVEAMAVE